MNKIVKMSGFIIILLLAFVAYQVYLAYMLSPSDKPRTSEEITQISCLESVSKLRFVGELSCQGKRGLKINIQNSDERIKGLAFFDGQNLIGKVYGVGPVYELKYTKNVSSFGYAAIIDGGSEEKICSINGGKMLRKC